MARPREFDQNDVLDKVVEVFWARGFEATSIQDLERATGLKRGSLYNAFGDKATLFREALGHYQQSSVVRRWLATAPEMTARQAIDGLLDKLVEAGAASSNGCLITNTVTELTNRDPDAAEIVAEALRQLELALASILTRARREGDLESDADPTALARFLVAVVQGLRVLSKVQDNRTALQQVADTAKTAIWNHPDTPKPPRGGFLDSLFGRPN